MWNTFFFAPRDVRPLAVMRMCVGVVVAWMLLERVWVARAAYSDEGWVPADVAVELMGPWHWSLFHVFDEPWQVVLGLVVGAAAALAFAAGALTRTMGLVAFVVLASVHTRNPVVLYGGDSVARIWLFYLLLMPTGRAWSIDAIVERIGGGGVAFPPRSPMMSGWAVRLLQIQIAVIYFMTGLAQWDGASPRDGTALWSTLANPAYSRLYPMDASWWGDLQPVLSLASVVTVWWELAFGFMLLFGRSRQLALATGILIHGGALVCLRLELWAPLMLIGYLSLGSGRFFHGLWLRYIRSRRARQWDHRLELRYDPDDSAETALARRIAAVDAFGLVRCVADVEGDSGWTYREGGEPVADDQRRAAVSRVLPWLARPFLGRL